MVAHAINPSALCAEEGGFLWVPGLPALHSEISLKYEKKIKYHNYKILPSPIFLYFIVTDHQISL